MRIFKRESVKEYRDILVSAQCNMCGQEKFHPDSVLHDLHECSIRNSYGTKHDGTTHHFDLCDSCYCKFIKSFKLEVQTVDNEELL